MTHPLTTRSFLAARRGSGWAAFALACVLAPAPARAETMAERWQRVDHLTPIEKEELKEKQDRFLALAPTEQDRLRDLQQRLESDPSSPRLTQVATRYAEWLKSLGASERSELLSLPADTRVAKIKELMARQQARQFERLAEKKLPKEDLDVIFTWLEGMIRAHEQEILAGLPADKRERLEKIPDEKMRMRVLIMLAGPMLREKIPQHEWQSSYEELGRRLSPDAKKAMEDLRDPKEKGRLVQKWVWAAVMSRSLPEADPAELRKLLQSPQITAEQRDYLESLPPERMEQELKRLYFAARFGQDWNRDGGGFFRPGSGTGGGFRPNRGPGGDWRGPGGEGRGPGGEPRGPGGEGRGPGGEPRVPGGEGRGPGGEPRVPGTEERPRFGPRDGEPRPVRPGERPPQDGAPPREEGSSFGSPPK